MISVLSLSEQGTKYDIVTRAIKPILPSLECNIPIYHILVPLSELFRGENQILFSNYKFRMNVKQLELCKNKPRITYLFTVAAFFLLLAFYHNLFCFFSTDLQSDAIFVFAAGQKTISPKPFLCHPVYNRDKGTRM